MEYRHLQNLNVEIETAPILPLLQIITSLKSYKDSTKELFVLIQQQYDDDTVRSSI